MSPFTVPQVKMRARQQNGATRRRTRNSQTFTFCGSGGRTRKDSGRFHQQTMINSHGRERAGPNCCHTQRKSTRGADAHTNEAKLVVMKPLFLFSSLTVYVKLLFVKQSAAECEFACVNSCRVPQKKLRDHKTSAPHLNCKLNRMQMPS